jgi:glycosyltransferase involved in cell wall biosynthesis
MLNISFIICSWQAPASLDEALKSIYSQNGTSDSFEVILVNNGFSETRAARLKADYPLLKMVDEPTPGLARARRAGFHAAQGEFFVCIDDDNLFGEGFLHSLNAFITQHPNLGCICPVVVPLWEETPPMWLQKFGLCCLSYTALTRPAEGAGKKEQVWKSPNFNGWPWPPGGGMIIHRSIAENYLATCEKRRLGLGRVRNSLGGFEDQDIYCRFTFLGRDAGYSERLLLYHKIPRSRTRMKYLIKLNFRMMRDGAVLERLWRKEQHVFSLGSMRSQFRGSLGEFRAWVRGRKTTANLLVEQARHAGFVAGWLHEALRSKFHE